MTDAPLPFAFTERPLAVLSTDSRLRLFRRMTKPAAPVYVRGGDYMAAVPMLTGVWQGEIVSLLTTLGHAGYGGALFDIGANLGLTTFASCHAFQRCYCFEPNPRVFHVLSANLYHLATAQLFNVGLGDADHDTVLTVPRQNDGGAFVRGQGNAYTDEELHAKEGPGADYLELPIRLRRGRTLLADLFRELTTRTCVLKVDVEGFEQTILAEIAAAVPADMRAAVVFENLSPRFDAPAFVAATFRRPTRLFKLTTNLKGLSTWRKRVAFLRHGRTYTLSATPADWIGDLVLLLD